MSESFEELIAVGEAADVTGWNFSWPQPAEAAQPLDRPGHRLIGLSELPRPNQFGSHGESCPAAESLPDSHRQTRVRRGGIQLPV
jgi:hypothetical protein